MIQQKGATTPSGVARRLGYAVALAINIALLVIVNNVLDWGWFSWLTADLSRVLPFINASLGASIAANAVYLFYDRPGFKSLAELGLLVISLISTIRLWQVFPFDFSAYDFSWGTLVRWLLGVGIFGICAAMAVQLAQLARKATAAAAGAAPEEG
ncbi:MAG: hypothetical protein JW785_11845 [Acidimicrobiia bacterium]|nr:hypothetical protein [Acidimicrobiia bacterium]